MVHLPRRCGLLTRATRHSLFRPTVLYFFFIFSSFFCPFDRWLISISIRLCPFSGFYNPPPSLTKTFLLFRRRLPSLPSRPKLLEVAPHLCVRVFLPQKLQRWLYHSNERILYKNSIMKFTNNTDFQERLSGFGLEIHNYILAKINEITQSKT